MFFTRSCAVHNIYYHVNKGLLKLRLSEAEILLPGLPPVQPQDMPSFIYDLITYPTVTDMLVSQFSNVDKADWVLFNTLYELEPEVIKQIN